MKRAGQGKWIICFIILAWLLISWIDVATHNLNKGYEYGKWNIFTWFIKTETRNCVVTDCQPEGKHYVVTIEDSKGNLWSYYDFDYRKKGNVVVPIWSENGNEIIGIKGGN